MFNEDRGANRGEWSELYTFRLFPIRMFSFEWFDYAGRVVSGCPSCFFCCYATSSLCGTARFPM